jgi:hypothetical protein
VCSLTTVQCGATWPLISTYYRPYCLPDSKAAQHSLNREEIIWTRTFASRRSCSRLKRRHTPNTSLLRGWVNKGEKMSRGMEAPARTLLPLRRYPRSPPRTPGASSSMRDTVRQLNLLWFVL